MENEITDQDQGEGGKDTVAFQSAETKPMPALGADFTPGPWEAPHTWDASGLVGNEVVHAPLGGQRWKSDTPTICTLPCDPLNRANARLIAAAPDMHKALVAISMIAGNLPDETLESCGGINEGRGRALMALSARSIARAALALVNGQDTGEQKG